jgi:NAD(P)-dependent dehydrogenase (short-subunit alcohol dehydrogenase family)
MNSNKWTAQDLPRLDGRTFVVTGANSGIGFAAARELGRAGARVVLAVRDVAKGETAAASIPGETEVRRLDLADLASIHAFADAWEGDLDVLVDNAGVMAVPEQRTKDGFEMQIGTNHLGHFALTNLLLPKITDRVATVSSMFHWMGRVNLKDLNWKARPYSAWGAYSQSKLANLLFTSELQRRAAAAGSSVLALAAHPGYSDTNLQGHSASRINGALMNVGNRLMATDADFGARQTLYAASQDLPGDTYIGPRFGQLGRTQPVGRSPLARNAKKAAALWELSEQLTDTKFPL